MNMNQKSLLIVVIIILVGAAGYFAFVRKSEPVAQQPSPTSAPKDETANWETYYNNEYGYSIAVPMGMGIEVNLTTSNIYLGGAANIGISIFYLKNNDPKILEPNILPSDFFEHGLDQASKTTVGGMTFYQSKKAYSLPGVRIMNTYVYGSKYNYQLGFSDEHDDSTKLDLANQIIGTFMFTK